MQTQVRTEHPSAPHVSAPNPAPQAPQSAAARVPVSTPRVDIYENDAEVLLLLDVPGVAPGDVHLTIDRGEIALSAPTAADHILGAVRYERAFLVPRGVQADGVLAELRNGVLKIVLPKGDGGRRRTVEVSGA